MRISWLLELLQRIHCSKETGSDRRFSKNDANDVVDDARSRHRMCQRVIVEQRITGRVIQMQVSTIGVYLAKNVFRRAT